MTLSSQRLIFELYSPPFSVSAPIDIYIPPKPQFCRWHHILNVSRNNFAGILQLSSASLVPQGAIAMETLRAPLFVVAKLKWHATTFGDLVRSCCHDGIRDLNWRLPLALTCLLFHLCENATLLGSKREAASLNRGLRVNEPWRKGKKKEKTKER